MLNVEYIFIPIRQHLFLTHFNNNYMEYTCCLNFIALYNSILFQNISIFIKYSAVYFCCNLFENFCNCDL